MDSLQVKVKVGTPNNHQSKPIENLHHTLRALLRANKSYGENN